MRRARPRRAVWHQIAKPKPDKKNKEGFPAYSGTPEVDLVNVLMTGSTANLFYASARTNVAEIVDVLKNFKDDEFLAKATVYAREQGYVREIPVASSIVLSTKSLDLFRKVVHRVCKNPHDWQKFIDIARSGAIRGGLGRALKREIIEAIRNLSVYHAIKYPKAVEDMINVAHPKEDVNPVVIRYIKKKETSGDPQLEALEKLKRTDDEAEIVRLINEGRLPYEVVTGSVRKMTPAIWEALLYQAPYFNLIRNLNNFLRYGVFDKDENLDYAIKKIKNKEAIRKSMLFPFRFYVAWKMVPHDGLKKALERAVEVSVENVPELEGKVCIAPDVSGSMSSNVLGDYSVLQCIDVVGVFTGAMIKKCKKTPIVLPFESEIAWDLVDKIMEEKTVMGVARHFYPRGGTSLSAPIEYLLKENIDVDYFIAFTDNEEWVGRSFRDVLADYINRVNPEVKVYLVTLLPYRDYPTPVYMRNVHYVFGWSDAVLRYISTDVESQIEEVEKVEL